MIFVPFLQDLENLVKIEELLMSLLEQKLLERFETK